METISCEGLIKPLRSPFVDMFRTKRGWIVWLALLIGAAFVLVAPPFPPVIFFALRSRFSGYWR